MILIQLLLGHMVGDYLLQNNWMALSKANKDFNGTFRCFIHCIIYTLSICVFTMNFSLVWVLAVFISHYPIDRYLLADKYLKSIKGRCLEQFILNGHKDLPNNLDREQQLNYRIIRGSFGSLVYVAVDNTFHILIMIILYYLIYGNFK